MIDPSKFFKRVLIFVHRWLGVALSVIFGLWFVSGIVMMYWQFPGVTQRDRLERAPLLNPVQIKFTPQQAIASLPGQPTASAATLGSFDGRPVYRFGGGGEGRGRRGGGNTTVVYADDGSVQGDVPQDMVDRAASSWVSQSIGSAKREFIEDVDQWTVASNLRTLRPLYKYSFPDGQQVYVTGKNAEVVQYTTSSSRFWAYLGAIPHWLYFTPLRKHQPQWFQFVVWSSGIGTVAALIGIVVAVWMLSPAKRYRHAGAPTSIPYRGWKRWHTIIGLVFGVTATTWAFSGMLSMGPFPLIQRLAGNAPPQARTAGGPRNRGNSGFNIASALRDNGPVEMSAFAAMSPQDAIASVSSSFRPRSIELTVFDGEAVYLATDASQQTLIIPVKGNPRSEFDSSMIMEKIRRAAGPNLAELRMMEEYDAYYSDRLKEKPLPVIYARVNDGTNTRYYIDPKTARVVGNYNSRNWVNRWLYHGLHSLDFPFLYKHRPLWDIVVIALMLGGTALCVTSLFLTWRVLQRKAAAAVRARIRQPSEDLSLELAPSTK